MQTPYRVLFVCTGNICRSPTAEAVLRRLAEARGWGERLEVDSAGTHDYHVGEAPDARSCEAAQARGYAMRHLKGRHVAAEDFRRFDLLLAMDSGHLSLLLQRSPEAMRGKVHLFLPYAGVETPRDVADPYYGPRAGFEDTLSLIERGCAGLLARIAREQGWSEAAA
jgi:protein-tyrosine phosphatase